jgi:hypothetical protein
MSAARASAGASSILISARVALRAADDLTNFEGLVLKGMFVMNAIVNPCSNGSCLAGVTADELNAVAGGANNSLFYVNRELAGNLTIYGVVFNDTHIAWRTADGKNGTLPL